jgi:hypothetical protein
MKTHAIEWLNIENQRTESTIHKVGRLNQAMWLAAKAFMAIVPALTIIVGSAWLITMPDLVVYLQATIWASGFLFLGLALDSQPPFNGMHLATGIALPVLALLSSYVAVELAVIAVALVGVWLAAGIFRR